MNLSVEPNRSSLTAPSDPVVRPSGPRTTPPDPGAKSLTADQVTVNPVGKGKAFINEVRVGFSHSWFLSEITAPPAKNGWISRNGLRVEAGHTLAEGARSRLMATASVTADKGHLSYLVVPAAGLRGEVTAIGPVSLYGSASVGVHMGRLADKPALGPQVHLAGGAAVKAAFVEYGIDRGPGLQGQNISAGVRLKF
jgi:hypothetical protein